MVMALYIISLGFISLSFFNLLLNTQKRTSFFLDLFLSLPNLSILWACMWYQPPWQVSWSLAEGVGVVT
jgi:hypothetical protein